MQPMLHHSRQNQEVNAASEPTNCKNLSDKLIKAFRDKMNTNHQMAESMDPFIGESSPKSISNAFAVADYRQVRRNHLRFIQSCHLAQISGWVGDDNIRVGGRGQSLKQQAKRQSVHEQPRSLQYNSLQTNTMVKNSSLKVRKI